jgi:hypothetical protein
MAGLDIGQACEILCNRQNHARRGRRGLFSIHTKYGPLDRRFFNCTHPVRTITSTSISAPAGIKQNPNEARKTAENLKRAAPRAGAVLS